jgi:glycosyltransferase involved in cell wall biosynthesis
MDSHMENPNKEDNDIRVSVLVTVYNLEKYVAQTIESVLEQETDFKFEILLGDDGSDDGTVDIVKAFISRYPGRIELYENPREKDKKYNRVERSAANRLGLLAKAKGKYCCFLDGDDYYIDKKKLQRQADILDDPANADCVICAHNLYLSYEDGRMEPLSSAKKERKISLKEYWTMMFIQANAMMFRNIYADNVPGERLAATFDDNNIVFWLMQHGKMYYIPEFMGAYRQVEGSSWSAIDLLKRSASNMVGYSVEMEVAPDLRKLSDIRHYPDLKYLSEHRSELKPADLEPFYTTAKTHDMREALDVYSMRGDWIAGSLRRGRFGYNATRVKRAVKKLFGLF